ncbi:TRAP transporter substrate-binding protein [Bacillus sp. M6-12]|uniref:TRAP transporter substrate-binding protein n=1 Tax=Bacillus sp. M6-12 TaxID=2054166 RepID=UPI0015E08F98|nr:TRAP transporter substrate-binding protein [Bacillus sp. M6-12]
MKKYFINTVVFVMIVSLLVACGGGETQKTSSSSGGEKKKYALKLGNIAPDKHVWNESALVLKEELAKRSNGRITLDLFPNASLGGEPDMIQQVQSGTLDMGFFTVAELSNHDESFSSWFMPFIMKDHNDAFDMAQTDEAKVLFDNLEGVQGLGYVFAGMRHVLTKDVAVTKPEDVKGMPIRVSPSPSITDWWKLLGAGPTPVPLPELYTAFQTGVVDAIDIDLDALMSGHYYEVGKEFTPMNHMVWPGGIVMNKALYDGMSDGDKKIINDSIDAAIKHNRELNIEREKSNLEAFKEKGGKVNEIDIEPFAKKANEIHSKYSKNEQIKAFIEKAKSVSAD